MKILKGLFTFSDVPDGTIHKIDVIEYEGHFWIVPYWIEAKDQGVMWPIRIVRIDAFQHQNLLGQQPADFVVNEPIPKSTLEGQIPPLPVWAVIENPPINVPIPPVLQ